MKYELGLFFVWPTKLCPGDFSRKLLTFHLMRVRIRTELFELFGSVGGRRSPFLWKWRYLWRREAERATNHAEKSFPDADSAREEEERSAVNSRLPERRGKEKRGRR